jgi:hypothetical protein
METCMVAECKEIGRYQLPDGRVVCGSHIPTEPGSLEWRRPTGCKTFCATRSYDREHLGERVTAWVRENGVEVTQTFVAQSSDRSFHAISIVVFFRER